MRYWNVAAPIMPGANHAPASNSLMGSSSDARFWDSPASETFTSRMSVVPLFSTFSTTVTTSFIE